MAAIPGPRTVPAMPWMTAAAKTEGKSDRTPKINAANMRAAVPIATNARFDLAMSMRSPAGAWSNKPASALAVRTSPMFAGIHPRSVKHPERNGPKPISRAARKAFSQSSACRLPADDRLLCGLGDLVSMPLLYL
jgi:hypothetical protein